MIWPTVSQDQGKIPLIFNNLVMSITVCWHMAEVIIAKLKN